MLWAVGRYDLGLGEEEFWRLSPRQFGALLERHNEEQRKEDWRAGMIAATIANALRGKKGKAYQAEDFMPRKAQTWQEQLAIAKAYTQSREGS